jgi:uncharacterized membrane protein
MDMTYTQMRERARERLKGFWGLALGVALVAALLGGASNSGVSPVVNLITKLTSRDSNTGAFYQQYSPFLLASLPVFGTVGLAQFVLGGPVMLGLKTFFLKLDRRQPAKFDDLFSQFDNFGNGFLLALLTGIFVFLWTLLLIVPGIIAAYSYAMAPYLMADDPKLGAMDAIRASKQMMKGHKSRLFWLNLSFIGWALLSALTLGIGYLWLTPYIEATTACFYNELKSDTAASGQNQAQGPEF